jgi:hypothetical protein
MFASICSYHMYLISIGQTTNEYVRDVYKNEVNVYNRGAQQNCVDVWTYTPTPSLLPDLSQVVAASDYINKLRADRDIS